MYSLRDFIVVINGCISSAVVKLALAAVLVPAIAPFSYAKRLPPGKITPPSIAGYDKLIFDDEFTTGVLRTDRWTANWLGCPTCITPPVQPSNESAAYDPARVRVLNGQLRLGAIESPVTVNGLTYPYRSGMIQSYAKADFTYGYFEALIYLPASGVTNQIANWPAFWTDGHNWPVDGENDILEGLSGSACYHFHSLSGGPGGCTAGNFTGWHLYGALWESGRVTYYYDGQVVGSITKGITNSPMYLILNYAVGSYGGAFRVPADMLVEYVHVYASDPKAITVTPDFGYGGQGDTAHGMLPSG